MRAKWLIIRHKSDIICFPGNCWGGVHWEAGILDHRGAADGELIHGRSLWTASCCPASATGTCTCIEMSANILISRTRSLRHMCALAWGWITDAVAADTRNGLFSRECPRVTIKTDNAAG